MKVLITGDTGFIGCFLKKKIEEKGYEVFGLNTKNGDICNYGDVLKKVKNMDIVFHLAGCSRVQRCNEKTDFCYKNIYRGSEFVSMACHKYNAKLVFASSRCVYGLASFYPTSESLKCTPVGFYGMYKHLAEALCLPSDFILRIGNVYGPSDRCHSVVTRFLKMIQEGETIPIFNNLDTTRDFVYVNDVVDAFMLGFEHEGVFNVGGGVETSIDELLNIISEVVDMPVHTIDMKQDLPCMINRVWLDISKIKAIGWNPEVGLKEGIKRCIDG